MGLRARNDRDLGEVVSHFPPLNVPYGLRLKITSPSQTPTAWLHAPIPVFSPKAEV